MLNLETSNTAASNKYNFLQFVLAGIHNFVSILAIQNTNTIYSTVLYVDSLGTFSIWMKENVITVFFLILKSYHILQKDIHETSIFKLVHILYLH